MSKPTLSNIHKNSIYAVDGRHLLYRVTILEVAKFYMPQIKRQSNVFSICLLSTHGE